MKLQVNVSGAWRDVCEFPSHELALARFGAGILACASNSDKFAIIDDQGTRYYYQAKGVDERWRTLKGVELPEVV